MGYDNNTATDQTTAGQKQKMTTRLAEKWRGLPPLLRWAVTALVMLLVFWFLYSSFFGKEETSYRTQPVVRGDIEVTVTALGSLQPKEYVDVGAQVSGQLKTVHVKLGDVVEEGQLLAEIDAKVYETEVDGARARLLDLQSQLSGLEAQLTLARRQHNRNLELAKIDAVSRDDLDTSETQVKTISASIGSTRAQIEQQKATVEGGETNLGFTKIYAPIRGTVTSQTALQGQTLNANQTAPVVLQIANLDTMTLEAQVAEADIGKLSAGMSVYFTTLGTPEKRWASTVRQILPTPEIVNEVVLYTVLIDIENEGGRLMKDMTAQVFFILDEARNVLAVPVGAVTTHSNGKKTVRVMTDKGIRPREVETGLSNRIHTEIKSGLEEGESVVTGIMMAGQSAPTQGGQSRRRPPGFF